MREINEMKVFGISEFLGRKGYNLGSFWVLEGEAIRSGR